MSTALIARAAAAGLTLWVEVGKLRIRALAEPPAELMAELKANKEGFIAALAAADPVGGEDLDEGPVPAAASVPVPAAPPVARVAPVPAQVARLVEAWRRDGGVLVFEAGPRHRLHGGSVGVFAGRGGIEAGLARGEIGRVNLWTHTAR